MHYISTAFSQNEDPTIEPKNPSIDLDRLGQREGFSINDVHHVRALYCAGKVKSIVLCFHVDLMFTGCLFIKES